nr:MAG TPA_asm: hypothetical protein [Caudoviricetes sp.]DAL61640.1 MAG TPA_asm: hypothetical protein [Caudoviricetes sp.]
MACRVAITISVMENSFLFLGKILSLAVGKGFF